MTRVNRLRVVAAAVGIFYAITPAVPALAAQIVQPSARVVAALDASGVPVAITVVASGFRAGALVYIEQCDGVALTTSSWSPTVHCDLGSSPSPAIADARGVATFSASDRNRAFRPFLGESPQSLFNCLAPGQRAPANSLPSFPDCTVRVSTSNTAVTTDQSTVPLVLTTTRAATPTTVGATTTTKVAAATAKPSKKNGGSPAPGTKRGDGKRRAGATSTASVSIAAGHGPNVGLLSFSDSDLVTGYILVLGGLLVAALTISLRRRNSASRFTVTGTQTVGER